MIQNDVVDVEACRADVAPGELDQRNDNLVDNVRNLFKRQKRLGRAKKERKRDTVDT